MRPLALHPPVTTARRAVGSRTDDNGELGPPIRAPGRFGELAAAAQGDPTLGLLPLIFHRIRRGCALGKRKACSATTYDTANDKK